MSLYTPTLKPQRSPKRPQKPEAPPLNAGDHLSRAEFERRYQAHPEIKKAELIEGVVYMASPVRFQQHGSPHFDMIGWLSLYRTATPYVLGGDNVTVILDNENEVQPDILLRLAEEVGGKSKVTQGDYMEGSPELIIEIAASSAAYDLHDKKRVYARNGLQEYLVVQMYEQQIDWFRLREGVYESLLPDESETLRSEVFPGLWLHVSAFWEQDLAQLTTVLQQGLSSPEHVAFVEQLQSQHP